MGYLTGFFQKKLEVRIGKVMGGYSPLRTSCGEHDPLFVKTQVFVERKKKQIIVICMLDLVAVDEMLKASVEKGIKELGITNYTIEVFVFATHTHSGPAGILDTTNPLKKALSPIFGYLDSELMDYLVDICVETIRLSLSNLHRFKMQVLKSNIEEIGQDRHDQTIVVGNTAYGILFHLDNGEKTILFNYPCHPTVLNGSNQLFSADFLCGVYRESRKEINMIGYINGDSANISTRFTRKSNDFIQAFTFGKELYLSLINSKQSKFFELDRIKLRHFSSKLKVKQTDENKEELLNMKIKEFHTSEFLSEQEKRATWANIEGLQTECILLKHVGSIESIDVPYTLMIANKQLFIMIPGEITSGLTKKLREKYNAIILGLCNDYLFYFAESEYYELNYYEAQSSFFKKNEAEKFMLEIENNVIEFLNF